MTLNITLISPQVLFQSSDFRVSQWDSARKRYRTVDSAASKEALAFGWDWSATVCFTGVARAQGGVDVPSWLGERVQTLCGHGSFDELVDDLRSANKWLRHVPSAHRRHTFVVAGFDGGRARVSVVSNFEHASGLIEDKPRPELFVTNLQPTRPTAVITGQSAAITVETKRLLIRAIRSFRPTADPTPSDPYSGPSITIRPPDAPTDTDAARLMKLLASVNRNASSSAAARGTVSEGCLICAMQADGQAWFAPEELPNDVDYIPPFTRWLPGVRIPDRPATGEPIRLVAVSANRGLITGLNRDAIALALLWWPRETPGNLQPLIGIRA